MGGRRGEGRKEGRKMRKNIYVDQKEQQPNKSVKKIKENHKCPDVVTTPLIPELGRRKQVDLWESKASPLHRVLQSRKANK